MLEDQRQVTVLHFEQLQQPVLDLDVEVGPGQAQPGGRLQGPAGRGVEFAEQDFRVDGSHGGTSRCVDVNKSGRGLARVRSVSSGGEGYVYPVEGRNANRRARKK